MKRLLLDTHVLLWWPADDPRLAQTAKSRIADGRNEIYVRVASAWEISIKRQTAPDDIDGIVEQERFSKLAISLYHGEAVGQLRNHHKDPFDRMLIAQAQAEGLTLVTADETFSRYPVAIMNAR